MQANKDKDFLNEKGQPHGYWEIYYPSGRLWFKGNYVNGKENGCWERYLPNSRLWSKGNFVNGEKIGLWFEVDKEYFYAD